MTILTNMKRILLAGVLSIALIGSSLTALAEEPENPVGTSDAGSITFPVSHTWNLNGTDPKDLNAADLTVGYTIVQEEDSYNDGKESVDPSEFELSYDETTQNVTIKATHAGVYTYTLQQVAKDPIPGGYTYDNTVYTVRVYVKNNGQGGLKTYVLAEDASGKKATALTFANSYQAAHSDDESNDPPVKKIITGDKEFASDTFTFVIEADESNPTTAMPENTEITVIPEDEEHSTAEFGRIEFTKVGTYRYYVKEVNDGLHGYTYDETVYTVIYEVTTEDIKNAKGDVIGKRLVSARSFERDGEPLETPLTNYEFENTFQNDGREPGRPEHKGGYGSVMVYKVDAASNDIRLSGVTFEVTKTNGEYVTTITTDEKGMAAIKSLPTGTYRLKEIKSPDGYQTEDRYVYFDVIKDTTIASPTNVKVTNTKAESVLHIVAIKQWANVHGVTTPDSVTFTLTRDGVDTGVTQVASAANNWTVDFGLVPDDADYEVIEAAVPDGYAVTSEKVVTGTDVVYTITNTYTGIRYENGAYTGDDSSMMLYAGIMGVAVVSLMGWFAVNRKRR